MLNTKQDIDKRRKGAKFILDIYEVFDSHSNQLSRLEMFAYLNQIMAHKFSGLKKRKFAGLV